MSVHMVRLTASADSPTGLITNAVPQWFQRQQPWGGDDSTAEPRLINAPDGRGPYYLATWRFEYDSTDPVALMGGLRNAMGNATPWFQLAYHVCEHDTEEPPACGWDAQDTGGRQDIPDDIPQVTAPNIDDYNEGR